jgi:hypothetical protein
MDMKRIWLWRGLRFALFAAVAVAIATALVMALWNALLPALFGWPAVGFWQALGLLLLSRLLLGGWRTGAGGGMHWRARMHERRNRMTEEERAQFRDGLQARCGGRRAATQTRA